MDELIEDILETIGGLAKLAHCLRAGSVEEVFSDNGIEGAADWVIMKAHDIQDGLLSLRKEKE